NEFMQAKKIKIAVLCPGFGLIPRGIETVVKEVFFLLSENNNEYLIDIYCGAKPTEIRTPKNIKIKYVKLPKFNTYYSKLYKKIAKKLKYPAQEEYDFNFMIFAIKIFPRLLCNSYDVIFNNAGIFSAYICRFIRKIANIPYIHSGHAGINNLELALAKQKPDVYIASTQPAKEWLAAKFKNLKIEVIPNGINPEIFRPYQVSENKLNITTKMQRPIYLFVGALTYQKQPLKLLNAFLKLKQGSLIIVGDGPLKNELLNIVSAAKISSSRFLYLENVDYSKLPDYFNFCDYFTMLSQNETFGIVYIMALACNKPILAEDSPQQKWMLGAAALYCDSKIEEEALTQKLIELKNIEFGNIPLELSKKYYWSNIVKLYDSLIKDIAIL
ncbi:MAG TPA: glycosyltransferase family 4 protein, partial [bacterium]|nr:glycosyltransferase family 4 protein [bacterium]